MAHGAGGKATRSVEGLFLPAFAFDALEALDDAGRGARRRRGLALTTDAFVVSPLRFPGGSIGELAVNGTVNDLAVAGARPLALTLSVMLEEGLDAKSCGPRWTRSPGRRRPAGVDVVAGDTKVVERGHGDGLYICTTGVGAWTPGRRCRRRSLRPGDRILVSGRVGEHGTAIMLARGEFELAATVRSDTRRLWSAVDALLDAAGPQLRCMRDATRGGVAIGPERAGQASGVAMLVREAAVPVAPAVAGACEILGIDPLYVANEGKLVAVVAADAADAALAALRAVPGGEEAAEIGEVRAEPAGMVLMKSGFGGTAGAGPAGGGPAPPHLLRPRCTSWRSPTESWASCCRQARRAEGSQGARGGGPPEAGGALGADVRLRARGQGTDAEGAELELEEVPAAGVCRACGSETEMRSFPLACRACGGLDVEITRGEELRVDWLEIEESAETEEPEASAGAQRRSNERGRCRRGPHPLDLRGDELRRGFGLHHGGHAAVARGRGAGLIPGLPKVHLHNKVL